MSQIEISCIGQTAIFTNTPEIFSGDIGVDTVKFTFDELWDSYRIKTAVFYNNSKETYTVILDENNVAVIPENVMTDKCKLNIGVFGTNANGDVKTSKIVTYHIGKGAISNDLESPTTTPDLWVQILARQTKLEADVETIESIAKGCNKALAYTSYAEMIDTLNAMGSDELIRGQNIYIGTVGVPDLWVYSVETENVEYTYVDDLTFVENMDENTTIQVGYFKLAQLETQEVDIVGLETDYNSVKSDIDLLKGTIGYTSKNYLENKLTTQTASGVTFTVNADKSISLSGTATGHIPLDINTSVTLDKGTYIFSGFSIDYADSRLVLQVGDTHIILWHGIDSVEFTLDEKTTCNVFMVIQNGTPCANVVIKPMIRLASIKDNTYVPYVTSVEGVVGNWTPMGTVNAPQRNYYIKHKNSITIFFMTIPTEALTTTVTATPICDDVCKTFGITSFRESFTVGFCLISGNGDAIPIGISAKNNTLNVERMSKDTTNVSPCYGQITLVTA